jgi:hypothetical protein
LLTNSLKIKTSVEKMIEAASLYDTEMSMENLGAILRVTADFDSY